MFYKKVASSLFFSIIMIDKDRKKVDKGLMDERDGKEKSFNDSNTGRLVMAKNTQGEAGKVKTEKNLKGKNASSEKKNLRTKKNNEAAASLTEDFLAPEGATEQAMLAMEDEMNGTRFADDADTACPVYLETIEVVETSEVLETTETTETTEEEKTMYETENNESTYMENTAAEAIDTEAAPEAAPEIATEAAPEATPETTPEAAPATVSGRKVAAVLKKNACAAIRDVISKGTLAEHVDNEDFLNILKLAIGYKQEIAEGAPKAPRSRMNGKLQNIETMFIAHNEVSEFALFEKFSIGRAEMMAIRRKFATKENAAERLYLTLDTGAKAWKLAGTGENKPEGFHLQTRRTKDNA